MTTQTPLGTRLGPATTSEEVLHGVDLHGTTVLVTGAGSGLGLHTAASLIRRGARVLALVRRVDTARAALGGAGTGLDRVEVVECDLADLASIRRASAGVAMLTTRLDVIIAAAGVMATPRRLVGPGWESQLATNHIGHRALLDDLLPLLRAARDGSRVVLYSSLGHHASDIHWDDLHFEHGYDKWVAYGQSKTANVLTAVHLDLLGHHHGIRAFALHPGKIMTGLQRDLTRAEQVEQGWVNESGALVATDFKTISQGAATGLWAATSPDLDGYGGVYLEDCDVAALAGPADTGVRGVMPYAVDAASADRLWQITTSLVAP